MLTTENIVNDEHEDYCLSSEEFVATVLKPEFNKYVKKLNTYAKTHSLDKCIEQTGKWWDTYKISESTETALDAYITAQFAV